jgi:hypothetical protein
MHPIRKTEPELPKDDPRFVSLVNDVHERGVLCHLLIVEHTEGDRTRRLIIDGRNRWRAAKLLGIGELPWRTVPDDQTASVILAGLIHRMHYTKSAIAYLAFPLMILAHQEAQSRRLQKLKKGQQFPVVSAGDYGETVEELAERIGVGRNLYFEAKRVHQIFQSDREYKALMEPKILRAPIGGEHEDSRPVGLGAVVAGYGGKGVKQERGEQLELFARGADTFLLRWQRLPESQRRQALRRTASAWPQEFRADLAEALEEAAEKEVA